MTNHYVYRSYEPLGRSYIGCRSCSCSIENDLYLGSYRDQTFFPTQKEILAVCETREEALRTEMFFHEFYDVAKNPKFANRAKQTSTSFSYDRTGETSTPEHCQRISNAHKGKKLTEESIRKRQETRGEYPSGENHPFYGQTQTEKARAKIKEARAKQTNIPGKGVDWWEHEDGSFRRCELCPGEGWMLRKERTKLRNKAKKKEPHRRYVNKEGLTKRSTKHPGEGWQNGTKWKPEG